MNKKYLILSLLLVFFISEGQSLGENANNSSIIAVADFRHLVGDRRRIGKDHHGPQSGRQRSLRPGQV